jgi:NADH dehydrogenase (ubiquinone) 1 alpha subcomplex subunit 2
MQQPTARALSTALVDNTRRKFISTHYKTLKAANPELPVLLRECAGTEARVTARFGASSRRLSIVFRCQRYS